MLFHIALPDDWTAAQATGRYTASTRGRTLDEEGYIHCSFAEQVAATAARFYGDLDEVVVLQIDPDRLTSAVVVEDLVGSGEAVPPRLRPDRRSPPSSPPPPPTTRAIRF